MKTLDFSTCQSREDIEAVIKEALQYETIVADDDAAEQWFREAGFDEPVYHRLASRRSICVWSEENQGEIPYYIYITEHYTDSGAEDYVYSYRIVEP